MQISLWLGLNLMDLITTLQALEQGHFEGNPIMSGLAMPELIAYKAVFTLLTVALLTRIKRLYLLKWLCFGIGLVVIWNLVWVVIT